MHPTLRNTGGNQVTIEDYEEFRELMDLDRLREITLDNWTLYKWGEVGVITTDCTNCELLVQSYTVILTSDQGQLC